MCFGFGEDPAADDEAKSFWPLQRKARAAPRHDVDGDLGMPPIFELRGANPDRYAGADIAQQNVLAANAKLARRIAHRRAAVATTARLMEH